MRKCRPLSRSPKASALPTALHPDDYSDVVAVVVKHVAGGGFLMCFETSEMDENAGVSTVPGVGGFVRGGKAYTLPKQARYQLRYTPMGFFMWSPLWTNMWRAAVCGRKSREFVCLTTTNLIIGAGTGKVK